MSRIVCIPGVSTHRGEAMGGLRGLRPPNLSKLAPQLLKMSTSIPVVSANFRSKGAVANFNLIEFNE